ncbi:MAG: nuclear transport factor 2 family protein [Planctomycetes bacterium]|nr:nuclear transport factor 2 family protein [Planctomycetota bacterium]
MSRLLAPLWLTLARWCLGLGLCALAGCASLAPDASPLRGELIAVCRAQEAAWNRGDLEAFMAEGYWRSPELSFFSGGSDTRGYDAMLARYRERYTEGGREMGKLSFTQLEALLLSGHSGLVRGQWKLAFSDGKEVSGLFTLALWRMTEGWRIVHDHTSVAD